MLQTLDSCCQSHKCWLGYRNDHFHSTVHSWCLIPYRSSKENTGFWWILQETCLKERESRKTQRKEALHPFEHYAGHMIGKSVYISIFILENFINDYVIFIQPMSALLMFPHFDWIAHSSSSRGKTLWNTCWHGTWCCHYVGLI